MDKFRIKGLTFEPYISNEEIQKQIARVAQELTHDYAGKKPLFVCVLNGAFMFAADLFRKLEFEAEIQFIRYKSYEGMESNGNPQSLMSIENSVKDRPVVIIEDIVDTGLTAERMIADLKKLGPSEVKLCSLLFKPDSLKCGAMPDYFCFSIPPRFILGYGLDIDEYARNLPEIYVLSKED